MDMMELLGKLRAAMPWVEFHYYQPGLPADALLILNACQAECASRPPFPGPVILVSPGSVNHWPVPPEQLCGEIMSRLSALASGR